jgi:surface antigen
VALRGAAADWWEEAAGRYVRAERPRRGDLLVFRRSGRLPSGHVAVVRGVEDRRTILVDQANWVHRRISRGEPVVDVSPGNDWSEVRVWWSPAGQLGVSPYATYGFIRP